MIPRNYCIQNIASVLEDGTILASLYGMGDQPEAHYNLNVDIGNISEHNIVGTANLKFIDGKLHQQRALRYDGGPDALLPGWHRVPAE